MLYSRYRRKEIGAAEGGAISVPLWGTSDLRKGGGGLKFDISFSMNYNFQHSSLTSTFDTGAGSASFYRSITVAALIFTIF